ncbi:hypothetical protein B5X24_HaOG212189 [Helicoverpa armigera]|nr:hypothetical protein B5X24_HaOG212189 [Helicoverpa armigera]
MADSDRIVFPDELAEAKADVVDAAPPANKTSGKDHSKKVEKPPKEVYGIHLRNAIVVPSNCDMASNGVCYEVHKDEEFRS